MIAWTTTASFAEEKFSSTTSRNWVLSAGTTSTRGNFQDFGNFVTFVTDITTSSFFLEESKRDKDSTLHRIISELKTTSSFIAFGSAIPPFQTSPPFLRGFYSDVVSIFVTGTEESVDEQTTSSEFDNDPNDVFYTVTTVTSGTIFHTTVPFSEYQQTSTTETYSRTIGATTSTTTFYSVRSWNGSVFLNNTLQTTSLRQGGTSIETTYVRERLTELTNNTIYHHNVVFDTIFKAETRDNGNGNAEVLWFLTGEYVDFILPLNQFGQTVTQTTFSAQKETKKLELVPISLIDSQFGNVITNRGIVTETQLQWTAAQGTFKQVTSANYGTFPPISTQANIISRRTASFTHPQASYGNTVLFPVLGDQTQTKTYAYSTVGKIGINAPDISHDVLYTKFEKGTATVSSENTLLQRFMPFTQDTSSSSSFPLFDQDGNPFARSIATSFSNTASGDASAEQTARKNVVGLKYNFGISALGVFGVISTRIPSITYFGSIGAKVGNNLGGAYTAQALFGTRNMFSTSHNALIDVRFNTPFPKQTSFLSGESTINLNILENGYSFTQVSPNGQSNQGFAGFNIIGATNTTFTSGAGYLGANGQESWVYVIPPNAYKVIKSNSTFTTVYNDAQSFSGVGSLESSFFQAIPIAGHLVGAGFFSTSAQSYIITATRANDWFVTSRILPF